jgi:hypothetical protein
MRSTLLYLLSGIVLFVYNSIAYAETLVVPYSSFYSHTKKLQDEDTSALQFAFGFKLVQSTDLCTIESAFIHTQKQNLPITIIKQQRFTLPSDKILKMAKADVVLELQQAANRCDMSVQLETKAEYLKKNYSQQELQMLLAQYQAFFNDMGSFLSFLMPDVQGLTLHFTGNPSLVDLPKGLEIENGKLLLPNDWIQSGKGLALQMAPLRITAIIVK